MSVRGKTVQHLQSYRQRVLQYVYEVDNIPDLAMRQKVQLRYVALDHFLFNAIECIDVKAGKDLSKKDAEDFISLLKKIETLSVKVFDGVSHNEKELGKLHGLLDHARDTLISLLGTDNGVDPIIDSIKKSKVTFNPNNQVVKLDEPSGSVPDDLTLMKKELDDIAERIRSCGVAMNSLTPEQTDKRANLTEMRGSLMDDHKVLSATYNELVKQRAKDPKDSNPPTRKVLLSSPTASSLLAGKQQHSENVEKTKSKPPLVRNNTQKNIHDPK